MALAIVFPDGKRGDIDDLMDYIMSMILEHPDATLKIKVDAP
jgi:hypothetical protein